MNRIICSANAATRQLISFLSEIVDGAYNAFEIICFCCGIASIGTAVCRLQNHIRNNKCLTRNHMYWTCSAFMYFVLSSILILNMTTTKMRPI